MPAIFEGHAPPWTCPTCEFSWAQGSCPTCPPEEPAPVPEPPRHDDAFAAGVAAMDDPEGES